MTISSSVANFI